MNEGEHVKWGTEGAEQAPRGDVTPRKQRKREGFGFRWDVAEGETKGPKGGLQKKLFTKKA